MGKKAMALFTAAAMLLPGVSCAKKGGSSALSEKEKKTVTQEATTAATEEETIEMATEHISPVETVSAIIGSQMTDRRTIGRAQGSNTAKFPLADLIDEGDRIISFTFVVYSGDGASSIGEFKGGCGISVDDKCAAATHKGWYQSEEFTAPTQGTYGEITWNVPDELKDYIHESGEVMFGYWWGNCESLRIENVICTLERTREVPVDGAGIAKSGESVNYSEGDRTVRVPLDFIPSGMVPEVVTFSIESDGRLGKFTGAFGINSSAGEYTDGDTAVFTDDSALDLVWFVPDKAKGYIADGNELLFKYWWSEQPSVTLKSVNVKYSTGTGDYPAPETKPVLEVATETAAHSLNGFRSAAEIVSDIKVGWNLGNTLDSYNTGKKGLSTEVGWGNMKTTKEMIQSVKSAGFNAVRIPVTWAEHMDGDLIRKEWLDRVQEVVDYAYSEDLFVILNMHHDDYIWFDPQAASYEEDSARLKKIWEQIAERFADYDDRLLFEGMNEPRTVGSSMEWMGGTKEERRIVNKYARDFVSTVRASGGKNADRSLIVTSYAASADSVAINDMSVPGVKNVIFSVHYYAPWNFAEGNETVFTESGKGELEAKFSELKQKFIDKGIPVIIDEFGCVNAADAVTRSSYYTYYISAAKSKGIKCFVWDNGKMSGESSFGIFNRGALSWEGNVLSAIMEGAK
ncbi:MAG: cellulase family glycosylhydrolase [Ruminococcus sp.]|nr:cellulase family glycosylhydrolase [Ruminococcus sp.]